MEKFNYKNITEEDFYTRFIRQKNHFDNNAGFDGCMFETYGRELDYVLKMSKGSRVITIIEGDEEVERTFISDVGIEITEPVPNITYLSGLHFVNRLGYFVLERPYEYDFEVKVD